MTATSSPIGATDEALEPQALDPFRGNGWAGQRGHIAPEVALSRYEKTSPLTEGAEIWRYEPDGTQGVFAVLSAGRWILV